MCLPPAATGHSQKTEMQASDIGEPTLTVRAIDVVRDAQATNDT